MTSKSKKNKSVERTKPDKSKKVEPEIIQIKQPLSRGNQNANSNKNTQVVQIIFPEDTELRKVKKKKKGKSTATKKREKEREELLNELKQKLEEYDRLQEQAQKLQIQIPEELGIKVINQGDLKTNDDIANYISDVVNKISRLQQLIQQSQSSMSSMSSLGGFNRLGAGIINIPTQPASRPIITPPQPPVPVIPPSKEEDPLDPKKKEELDKIAKELQDKLDSGGGGYAPFVPSQPPGSQEPIKDEDLVETKGVQFGNQRVDIRAPRGFVELYNRYRRFLENVAFDTQRNEIMEGIYHIPLDQENDLFNERDGIVRDYRLWFNSLDRNLNAYMLNPSNKIEYEMNRQLGMDSQDRPQDIAKRLFNEQGVKYEEITGGNELPNITQRIQQGGENPFKKASDNKAYKDYQIKNAEQTNKLINIRQRLTEIEKSGEIPIPELQELGNRINKLETEITNVYNELPPNVRIGVFPAQDAIHDRFNQERIQLGNIQNPPSSQLTPTPQSPNPAVIDPVIDSDEAAIQKLQAYSKKNLPSYTQTIKASVLQLFGEKFYNEVKQLSAADRRIAIVNKFAEYMRTKDPNWSPPNRADDDAGKVNPQRRMISNTLSPTFMF